MQRTSQKSAHFFRIRAAVQARLDIATAALRAKGGDHALLDAAGVVAFFSALRLGFLAFRDLFVVFLELETRPGRPQVPSYVIEIWLSFYRHAGVCVNITGTCNPERHG